jgi:DNA-binding response OmpR family regulator
MLVMPKKLILLIEDDPNMAYLLQFMLEREGYEVVHLQDGNMAKSHLEDGRACDLIILDLMLPYVDGFELLKLIRMAPQTTQTPVIVLSAKEQEADVVRAFSMGCDDYVKKPFVPGELLARIRRHVQKLSAACHSEPTSDASS